MKLQAPSPQGRKNYSSFKIQDSCPNLQKGKGTEEKLPLTISADYLVNKILLSSSIYTGITNTGSFKIQRLTSTIPASINEAFKKKLFISNPISVS